jgi:hypothetical protein
VETARDTAAETEDAFIAMFTVCVRDAVSRKTDPQHGSVT